MKKFLYPSLLAVVASTLFFAYGCNDKNNPNNKNAIQGTYKEESTGTAANPNIGVVTVTGTSTLTNPATQNTSIQVAGAGWSYDGCVNNTILIGTSALTAHNGSTQVNIVFGSQAIVPTAPTVQYTLTAGTPSAGQAKMTISNAPGQPDGIVWYSKSGLLTVTTVTSSVGGGSQTTASFNNVQCLQYSFLFPVVTASGAMVCQ